MGRFRTCPGRIGRPHIEFVGAVSGAHGGASARVVAEIVTTVLEQQINGVQGMAYMSSVSALHRPRLTGQGVLSMHGTIDGLRRTATIVLVTHKLRQAVRCADWVAVFCLGEMIETGSAQRLFTAPKLPRTQDYS